MEVSELSVHKSAQICVKFKETAEEVSGSPGLKVISGKKVEIFGELEIFFSILPDLGDCNGAGAWNNSSSAVGSDDRGLI